MSCLPRNFFLLLRVLCMFTLQFGESHSGLLSSTLQTFEHIACDGEEMTIKCPKTTMISVQFSQYGRQLPSYQMCPSKSNEEFLNENTNCLATSSLTVLFDKCQNKQRCQVAASTNVFRQDPCPKTSKYLKVTYKCNPSAFSNATVCEGEQLQLSCDRGTRIAVYSAMYGRTPSETSKCTNNNQRYADCRSSSALEQVMAVCHGQKKCAIEAQEYVFGNPCPKDIQKYLNVVYTCIPKKVLKQMRKIRHRNKKGRRKKGKKSTTVPNVTQENVSVSQSPSLVNKSTQNMYPADDSKQWNTDKTANLNVNNNNDKTKMTPSGEMTHSSVFCGNHSHLATPAPSSIGTGGSGMLVDWFNALNFLKENEEKAVLYMVLGITFGLLLLLIVIIIKLVVRNKRQRRTKLDVTDPVHMNSVPPDNHIEAPTLSRHDSMDRIEVVRFEPRSTLMRASLLDNGDRSLNHYYG